MSVKIQLHHADHSSLVYLVNHLPLLSGITVQAGEEPVENIELVASFEPDYMEPIHWRVEKLAAGASVSLKGQVGRYDIARLRELGENMPGRCTVKALAGKEATEVAREDVDFTWLPYNAWAGRCSYPELLAALVLPNDEAIDRLLRSGADILRAHGLSPSWTGYKNERNAIINQIHALWQAVDALGLTYALPPRSWSDFGAGQKVRTPSQIVQGGCATCLDSTALMAAALAQAGFNPIIVICPGHAFVGAWLKDDVLPSPKEEHAATLRNLQELGEILLLETTMLDRVGTGEGKASFADACESATRCLQSLQTDDGFCALDIVRLWATGIRPIAGGANERKTAVEPAAPATASADTSGFLPETTAEDEEAALSLVPKRKRTRMENWQLKLLDLSMRNNLLNASIDRTLVPLLLPSAARLEDALADGKSFTVCHLPDTFGTRMTKAAADDAGDAQDVAEARARMEFLAREMFEQKQLLAPDFTGDPGASKLERRMKALYLRARHDIEESGSSTLNIACGFLKWFRAGDPDRPLYAPVLLLSVKLRRPSVKAGFVLQAGDEDTRINLTLLELLKTEYGIRIPQLEGELPTDDSGVDVPLIMQILRQAIRTCPGWEVEDRCAIGTFSFAKYLMWKDMVDRQDALLRNAIVRHLSAEEHQRFPEQVGFPDPHTLDNEADAMQVFTPLSADSSQLAAVLAAARGKNFVLIGPPGTGKSQTIANMIAHCLGHGKTVLFVAEKSAALHVVYKRLKRIGLGDFCLELHSNKANKKEVVAQFKSALDRALAVPEETRWAKAVEKMEKLRYELNLLPYQMHVPLSEGTSLFHDVCVLAQHPDFVLMRPCPHDPLECTAAQKEEMLAHAHDLALRFAPVASLLPGAAASLTTPHFSFAWEEELNAALHQYTTLIGKRQEQFAALVDELDGDGALPVEPDLLRAQSGALVCLLQVAKESCGQDIRALLPAQAEESLAALRELLGHAENYRKLKESLSLPYPDSTLDEPALPHWLQEWKAAQLSNFFSRFFATRRIRKALQVQAFSRQSPDCYKDLTALLEMKSARDAARALSQTPALPSLMKGLETSADSLKQAERWAGMLQSVGKLRRLAELWLANRVDNPMAPGRQTSALFGALCTTEAELTALRARLGKLVGTEAPDALADEGRPATQWAQSLLDLQGHWRELTLWNEQADKARTAGYGTLVDVLVAHKVEPDALQETSLINFSRLRIKAAVDSVPTLNRFTAHEHETRLHEFAAQDNAVLKLAGEHIVAVLSRQAALSSSTALSKELAFLQHEISKQRMHKAPRALLQNIPNLAPLLKPCMLMSPLSVAQHLTPESEPYDVVIFDEASQIPVWDAIGAIARGKSAVIVGDPRQMPPTSFFSRGKSQEESDEDDVIVQDMESILDECRACGIPEMNLTWHYRSKAESLIAFSNHRYYEDKLTTFPAPLTTDNALQYHYVKGTYLRGGKKAINPTEAKALVEHVVQTLKAPDFRYTELTSIGIVTFNTQQQKLIEDLLDDARAKDPSLEPFFAEDNPEAVFVKNLENVQGDERGCIYFSTTYGPDEKGVVSMNFGPLNLTGGERRLNVAVTRARASMHVFSSMTPEDIDLGRTKARGAADLKGFLECARMGASAYFGRASRQGDAEGGFTEAVAKALEARGWKCQTNVGVSAFRIDIAVEHPGQEGAMLAAIRTDGPAYQAACTARDRDILRESVLTGLGWRVFHLWALDWWRHPGTCIDALDSALRRAAKQTAVPTPEQPSLV